MLISRVAVCPQALEHSSDGWQSLPQTLPSWVAWAAWSFTSPVGGQGAGVDVAAGWTSARQLGLEIDGCDVTAVLTTVTD